MNGCEDPHATLAAGAERVYLPTLPSFGRHDDLINALLGGLTLTLNVSLSKALQGAGAPNLQHSTSQERNQAHRLVVSRYHHASGIYFAVEVEPNRSPPRVAIIEDYQNRRSVCNRM